MYLGRIVESGPVARVFGAPRHPYRHAAVNASPIPDPGIRGQTARIVGENSFRRHIRQQDATFTPVAHARPICAALFYPEWGLMVTRV